MKSALIAGLLTVASLSPTLSPAQTTTDRHTELAVKRLERRMAAAERADRANVAALTGVKDAAAATGKQLAAVEESVANQGNLLTELKLAQASTASRINDESQRATAQQQALQATVSDRSNVFGALLVGAMLTVAGGFWARRRAAIRTHRDLNTRFDEVAAAARLSNERAAKADTALADSLYEVLGKMKEHSFAAQAAQATQAGQSAPTAPAKEAEPDHRLPSKLADEIHRMTKRLASLPEDTKGLTPLRKSVERLETELSGHGYEIVDHTGKPYTENMSVKARFIPSDDLQPEERVISKVVIPQLNYDGVMVRMADVEVSIGS